MISVVIPAYNESAVIDRLLHSLRDDTAADTEIIVVPNGCRDDTADRARCHPGVVVIDTPIGNKSQALNLGDEAAHHFPRFYVDADIEVTGRVLHDVADAMAADEKPAGAPRPTFNCDHAGYFSRRFYRHYANTSYLRRPVLGLGVYGVTEAGRQRFKAFPDATGDDLFIAQEFGDSERAGSDAGEFVVHVPVGVADLIKVRTRVYLGNWQGRTPQGHSNPEPLAASAGALVHAPERLSAVVYYGVNSIAKLRALRHRRDVESASWGRDDSSRASLPG